MIKRWKGDDGRIVKERHFSYHRRKDKHTNPHDHIILWDNPIGHPDLQGPINYPDGAPEFKLYLGNEYNMSKFTVINTVDSFEDDRFETISEFKWCVDHGGEVEFEWTGDRLQDVITQVKVWSRSI